MWNELFDYWSQNEPYFTLPKGASDQEIKKVETMLSFSLPESLKDSLKKCNSYPDNWEKVKKSSALLLGEAGQLYSTNEIIMWYKENMDYRGTQAYRCVYGDTTSPNSKWMYQWIPIYDYNANIFLAIDMRENNGIPSKKVLYLDFEYSILAVCADSYEEFLNQVLSSILQTGQYGSKDLENILRQYGIEPSE